MELKPMKKNENVSYPTVKEISDCKDIKNIVLASSIAHQTIPPVIYIAAPCYVAVSAYALPIAIAQLIQFLSIITTLLSSILFFINKKKTNNLLKEQGDEQKAQKLNKRKKIYCYLLWISIAIIIISTLFILVLENLM